MNISNLKNILSNNLLNWAAVYMVASCIWESSFPKFSLSLDIVRFLKLLPIERLRNISFFCWLFFLLICKSLSIVDSNLLLGTYMPNSFSLSLTCLFTLLMVGFLNLGTTDRLGWISLCCEGCPGHCRTCSNIPGFRALDANGIPPHFPSFGRANI